MPAERRIRVTLTVAQWNALHSCGVGELESLTKRDHESGAGDDLASALNAMQRARRGRAASHVYKRSDA